MLFCEIWLYALVRLKKIKKDFDAELIQGVTRNSVLGSLRFYLYLDLEEKLL